MTEYIEREAFLTAQRHLYCENCAKRKGMKNGKVRIVYDIGDAPCRACGIGDVLESIEDAPAADVAPMRRGRWRKAVGTSGVVRMTCTNCGFMRFPENDSREPMFAYCPRCGALMKDGDGDGV